MVSLGLVCWFQHDDKLRYLCSLLYHLQHMISLSQITMTAQLPPLHLQFRKKGMKERGKKRRKEIGRKEGRKKKMKEKGRHVSLRVQTRSFTYYFCLQTIGQNLDIWLHLAIMKTKNIVFDWAAIYPAKKEIYYCVGKEHR